MSLYIKLTHAQTLSLPIIRVEPLLLVRATPAKLVDICGLAKLSGYEVVESKRWDGKQCQVIEVAPKRKPSSK